jgi:hypothetical protein
MVEILVTLLIFAVFLYILWMILNLIIPKLGLPGEVNHIIMAIIGLIMLIWLLRKLGVFTAF